MNKFLSKISALALLAGAMFFAVSCDDDPAPVEPIDEQEVLENDITANTTLDASKKYLIKGKVYVQSGVTLTIPAGTILFGDKITQGTLVVNRGGKIDAKGTASNPIIMTSSAPAGFRNRGDWGGVVLLGKAYTSGSASSTIEGISSSGSENGLYGPGTATAADDDNSGVMEYVRIEFAGIPLSQDNELNSLTLGSVGSATKIEHIQVSYGNDDAYEWFGGAVNHKYLIAFSTIDDDFDTDRGYIGKVQFALVVRDPLVADFSGSRTWESSSNNTATVGDLPKHGLAMGRHSKPTFSNVTVLGPLLFKAAGQINGFYQAAVEINSSSSINIHNSIITGFPTGVRFNASGAEALVTGNIFSSNTALTATSGGSTVPGDFETVNQTKTVTDIFGAFPAGSTYSFANAPFFQAAASTGLTGAPALVDGYFEDVAYYGAFGTAASAGWSFDTWTSFDPINETY